MVWVWAFSVIVKSSRTFVSISSGQAATATLLQLPHMNGDKKYASSASL